ncbi:TIM barrel protein [Leifsonia sp. L25]|uniref:sugar phosphate isomerase/epimerase family protein n=1 Tax=Actinomycetes TaxID=1760 RepID=UPI003D693C21
MTATTTAPTITAPATTRAFGVDLITFFDPGFWGLTGREELEALAAAEPRRVWDTILDSLLEAGVAEFEMTFAPADRLTAIAAYGSVEAFAAELERRGLSVVSAYFADIEHAEDVTDPATRAAILAAAETEAAFLAGIGASFLVAGLPMRRNNAQGDGLAPVDLATALPIADIANEVGAIAKRHGVTLALHTESHSVFWTPRDVDLFLLLTDPFLVAFCPDTGHIVLGGETRSSSSRGTASASSSRTGRTRPARSASTRSWTATSSTGTARTSGPPARASSTGRRSRPRSPRSATRAASFSSSTRPPTRSGSSSRHAPTWRTPPPASSDPPPPPRVESCTNTTRRE